MTGVLVGTVDRSVRAEADRSSQASQLMDTDPQAFMFVAYCTAVGGRIRRASGEDPTVRRQPSPPASHRDRLRYARRVHVDPKRLCLLRRAAEVSRHQGRRVHIRRRARGPARRPPCHAHAPLHGFGARPRMSRPDRTGRDRLSGRVPRETLQLPKPGSPQDAAEVVPADRGARVPLRGVEHLARLGPGNGRS
jgi:hypothetical protein